jgi:threonylcarbamoyladenosine tRNA methylthiotransferase MtaB
MKVALHNLGCKVNAYETDVMQQKLTENGFEIVNYDENADVYIVNTCSVTNMADRKSRQLLHRAKKNNVEAIVIAVGCYAQMNTEQAELDPAVDIIIGNNRKKDIVSILQNYLKNPHKKIVEVLDINNVEVPYEEMKLKSSVVRTRADIKIQDGCNQFCTYCIIPYARGRVRSRTKENVLEEATTLAKTGCKEIVLTGINISAYGTDFKEKNPFILVELMEALNEIEGIERIRIGSFEPRILTKEFVERLVKIKKLCPHFHLSLQSGSNSTLQRMKRQYTAEEYYDKVMLLRQYFENPAITTDVIVGFPGETEEEFSETLIFLKSVEFFEMHVFKYSRRKGTVADRRTDQIQEIIKTNRSKILLELAKEQSKKYRERFLGKEVEVLFEEEKNILGDTYQIGHTSEYIKVAMKIKEEMLNQIVRGKIEKFLGKNLMYASCNLDIDRVK